MERESVGIAPKTQSGFRSNLKMALRVMSMFLFGLWFTMVFGEILLEKRMPHSHWHVFLRLTILIVTGLGLFRKDKTKGVGQMLWFALCICFIPVYYQRAHDWAPVATGTLLAAFFWVYFKSAGRSYLFIPSCALLAGVFSLQVPWPNGQRCMLTFVYTGLAVTIQGAWTILRYLQGDRPPELSEPASAPNKSSDREMVRFIHLIFGTIGHIQIFSHELEQRIRKRYQSEISQLTDLGFDYLFSDGEAFSLFRLALILPALTVIHMRCNGEVIALDDGTKLLVCYPVFISRNKTAFGYASGLGVKFYTAFQDGTLLVSKAYSDANIPAAPMIVKFAEKASISETWAKHQERIAALEAEGKCVDRQTSFQAYAEISYKETAPW